MPPGLFLTATAKNEYVIRKEDMAHDEHMEDRRDTRAKFMALANYKSLDGYASECTGAFPSLVDTPVRANLQPMMQQIDNTFQQEGPEGAIMCILRSYVEPTEMPPGTNQLMKLLEGVVAGTLMLRPPAIDEIGGNKLQSIMYAEDTKRQDAQIRYEMEDKQKEREKELELARLEMADKQKQREEETKRMHMEAPRAGTEPKRAKPPAYASVNEDQAMLEQLAEADIGKNAPVKTKYALVVVTADNEHNNVEGLNANIDKETTKHGKTIFLLSTKNNKPVSRSVWNRALARFDRKTLVPLHGREVRMNYMRKIFP